MSHKNIKRSLWDYLFVLRPILMVPVWTMILAGYFRGQRFASLSLDRWRWPADLWWLLLFYSLLMGAVYIVNQIFDVETDRLNQKLFLVAEGYVNRAAIWIEAAVLMSGAIWLSFIKYPPQLGYIMIASGCLGLLYSVPPIKLKAKPFWDMAANGLGYGMLAFAAGWTAGGRYSDAVWLFSLPYVLAVSAVYLNTTIPDYASDRATGNITTGVFLGGRATVWLALALMLLSFILAVSFSDPLAAVASGCSLPLFLAAALTGKMRWTMLSYQGGALVLVLLLGLIFPVYFVLLLITLVSLRFYYKWRFNIDYPRFADRA